MATKTAPETDETTVETTETATEETPVKAKRTRVAREPKRHQLLVIIEDGQITTDSENLDLVVFNIDRLATAPAEEVDAAFYAACAIKDEPTRQRIARKVSRIMHGLA